MSSLSWKNNPVALFLYAALKEGRLTSKFASSESRLKSDPEFMLALLEVDPRAYCWIHRSLKEQLTFNLQALSTNPEIAKFLPEKLLESAEFYLNLPKLPKQAIRILEKRIGNSQKGAFLVHSSIWSLKIRPKNLNPLHRDNPFVMSMVCRYEPRNMELSSKRLRDNTDFVMSMLKIDGLSLRFASERLKKSRKVVLSAVLENGCAFEFADPSFDQDKQIVGKAVYEYANLLHYLGDLNQRRELSREVTLYGSLTRQRAIAAHCYARYLHEESELEILTREFKNAVDLQERIVEGLIYTNHSGARSILPELKKMSHDIDGLFHFATVCARNHKRMEELLEDLAYHDRSSEIEAFLMDLKVEVMDDFQLGGGLAEDLFDTYYSRYKDWKLALNAPELEGVQDELNDLLNLLA